MGDIVVTVLVNIFTVPAMRLHEQRQICKNKKQWDIFMDVLQVDDISNPTKLCFLFATCV